MLRQQARVTAGAVKLTMTQTQTPISTDTNTPREQSRLQIMWERLANELAKGEAQSLLTWLRASSNLRSYSSQNRILIIIERPGATTAMSEKAWNACGRTLRPDAKPVMIYAPRVGKRSEEEGDKETQEGSGPSKRRSVRFGQVPVYTEADTEGEALKRTFTPLIGADIEAVNTLTTLCPFDVHWDAEETTFNPQTRSIHIPGGKDQAEDIFNILTGWAMSELKARNPEALTTPETRQVEALLCAYALTESLGIPSVALSAELLAAHWGGKAKKLKRMTVRVDDTIQVLLNILMPMQAEEEHPA